MDKSFSIINICNILKAILIAGFWLSPLSVAEESKPFHALSHAWINVLLDDGVEQVGDLDLRNLKSQIAQLQFNELEGDLPKFIGTRESAYYTKDGHVYFKDNYPDEFPKAIQLLATHEALGALNFQDDDYGVSIILKAIAEAPKDKRLNLLNHPYVDSKFHADKAYVKSGGGGATGVGGGGDFMAAWVKYLVTQQVLKSPHSPMHLMFLDQVRFEPYGFGNPNIQLTISVDNKRTSHQGILGYMKQRFEKDPTYRDNSEMIFMVNVPTWYFQSHPETIEPAVDEMSQFFLEYMMGIRKDARAELRELGICGMSVMVVPQYLLESDLLKRSGGIESFKQDFKKSCEEDFGYEAKFY